MKFDIPHVRHARIQDTYPAVTHRTEQSGFRCGFASSGSFTKAEAVAHVAALSYGSPSTADAHAAAVAQACRDLPLLAAKLEYLLGAGLALLSRGATSDTSPAYASEAAQPGSGVTLPAGSATSPTPVAVTLASIETATIAALTDLAAISTVFTNAKDALIP